MWYYILCIVLIWEIALTILKLMSCIIMHDGYFPPPTVKPWRTGNREPVVTWLPVWLCVPFCSKMLPTTVTENFEEISKTEILRKAHDCSQSPFVPDDANDLEKLFFAYLKSARFNSGPDHNRQFTVQQIQVCYLFWINKYFLRFVYIFIKP